MKKLWSIFTDDMDHCIFTGSDRVERHHVFPGFNRAKCEKYGYIAPLAPQFHPNGVSAGENWKEIDTYLKQECQKDYEKNHGSREDFIKEFGRNYL